MKKRYSFLNRFMFYVTVRQKCERLSFVNEKCVNHWRAISNSKSVKYLTSKGNSCSF